MNKRQFELSHIVEFLSFVAGFSYGVVLYWSIWRGGISDPAFRQVFADLVVVAPLWTFFSVFAARELAKTKSAGSIPYFRWYKVGMTQASLGYEIVLLFLSWAILRTWVTNPDSAFYEPMFVVLTVALATQEWIRRFVKRQLDEEIQ